MTKFNHATVSYPSETLLDVMRDNNYYDCWTLAEKIYKVMSTQKYDDCVMKYFVDVNTIYKKLYRIVKYNRDVDAVMALAFEKVFGISSDFWIGRQKNYDDWCEKYFGEFAFED